MTFLYMLDYYTFILAHIRDINAPDFSPRLCAILDELHFNVSDTEKMKLMYYTAILQFAYK